MTMKTNAADLPVRLEANGVRILGEDWGDMDVGRLHVPAGGDTTPLLEGLPDDLCQCPHWGLLLNGSVRVRYADGRQETVEAGEVFYWPPGHTVWTEDGFESLQISLRAEMARTLTHVRAKLGLDGAGHGAADN
jgi:hypothetical protein